MNSANNFPHEPYPPKYPPFENTENLQEDNIAKTPKQRVYSRFCELHSKKQKEIGDLFDSFIGNEKNIDKLESLIANMQFYRSPSFDFSWCNNEIEQEIHNNVNRCDLPPEYQRTVAVVIVNHIQTTYGFHAEVFTSEVQGKFVEYFIRVYNKDPVENEKNTCGML